MPDTLELISIFNKVKNKPDFIAIGLYRKIADEDTLAFYCDLIFDARNGYIEDPKAG